LRILRRAAAENSELVILERALGAIVDQGTFFPQ